MNFRDQYLRRNMTLGILNGVFFIWAHAFLSGSTVIPLFISGLTDSLIIIGAFSTLYAFGWQFIQLFSGAYLAGRPLVMPFYNRLSFFRAGFFILALIAIFLIGNSNHTFLLLTFGILFTLYALSSGIAGIPFTDFVGKMIPVNKRGSFFGARMFFGGLLAALSGPVIKFALDKWEYPINFGYIYLISIVGIIAGLIVFAFVKESPKTITNHNHTFKDDLKSSISIFKNNNNIRRAIWANYLSNAYLLAIPFYIIAAINILGIPRSLAGTYLSFEMVGFLGANLLWARISNRVSNKLLLKLVCFCAVIAPLLAVISLYLHPGYFIYGLVFFFNGAAASGFSMGYQNYFLEIIDDESRPMTIGLVNTLIAPTVFMAALGGLISEIINLQFLFILTLTLLIFALINIVRLDEPSRQDTA